MVEYLLRSSFLRDHTAIHKEYTIGNLSRKAHLMGYDDSRHTGLNKVFDNMKNLSYHLRVKRGSRLVEKHYIRLHGERTHDGETLFLSAGELFRELVLLVRETDTV